MTKRPRPEDCDIQWPACLSQPNIKFESWEEHEITTEELPENSTTDIQTGCEEGVTETSQVAASEVAHAELVPVVDEVAATEQVRAEVADVVAEVAVTELGGGKAFWALLSRVGYSSWYGYS